MSNQHRLNLVFCWHMHQPQYRDLLTGKSLQSWTYLHAVKDYEDMADHLERYPDMRAVVNFVPLVLEEIGKYSSQIEAFLQSGSAIGDPLLDALAAGSGGYSTIDRSRLARMCLRANERRVIQRFAPYLRLVQLVRFHQQHDPSLSYVSDSLFDDLVVWYHLAWTGETIRRGDPRIQRLMDKAQGFTHEDRVLLLRVLAESLGGLVARYRKLQSRGQVELSMTPYAHPMLPLLVDFEAARDAVPEVSLPGHSYPGGEERVRWHIEAGMASFERSFGHRPQGCWPSEGGVSDAVLPLLAEYGFRWFASGQVVLKNSLLRAGGNLDDASWPYRIHRMRGLPLHGFFRDDELSDAIGFNYSDWHGEDAVADFVNRLTDIASHLDAPQDHVVPIIMDGENAWEHYPDNGYYFLDHLYEALSGHPQLRTTTFGELAGDHSLRSVELPGVCAGSWVYGSFSTWIGDPDKNRAWEILVSCKRAFDAVVADHNLTVEDIRRLERQLAVCEGSDWFWWFGDYNPLESIDDFSELFRLHISNLYEMMGRTVPNEVNASFGKGGDVEHGGAMRRGSEG